MGGGSPVDSAEDMDKDNMTRGVLPQDTMQGNELMDQPIPDQYQGGYNNDHESDATAVHEAL